MGSPAMTARPLAPGEVALTARVFGDWVDPARVRVHDRRYLPFQPANTAMSPNGQMYFARASHRADFSVMRGDAAWFVHEMTHVWQHQAGVWLRLRRLFEWRYQYGSLESRPPYARFNVEQQAAIVEDWFRQTQGMAPRYGDGALADYRAVLPFPPFTSS